MSPDILHHLDRQRDEDYLELTALGECEACGDDTDTPPVCRACAEADEEAARAWREGRD